MEMKVLLVDSDWQLCAELVVMLHMFQCFRVVENVQTAEEAKIGRASCRERV